MASLTGTSKLSASFEAAVKMLDQAAGGGGGGGGGGGWVVLVVVVVVVVMPSSSYSAFLSDVASQSQ
jgi:predicted metalloprotease